MLTRSHFTPRGNFSHGIIITQGIAKEMEISWQIIPGGYFTFVGKKLMKFVFET